MTKDVSTQELSLDKRVVKVKQKVFENSFGTCEYVSGFQKTASNITVKCLVHKDIFEIKYENIRHSGKKYYPCPKCQEEQKLVRYKAHRQEVECAYCHKKFIKNKAALANSKSGLYFCCREHKDLAQCVRTGSEFDSIRPNIMVQAHVIIEKVLLELLMLSALVAGGMKIHDF